MEVQLVAGKQSSRSCSVSAGSCLSSFVGNASLVEQYHRYIVLFMKSRIYFVCISVFVRKDDNRPDVAIILCLLLEYIHLFDNNSWRY